MNKFTDFSDQVTFVSSQIIGRDFSGKKGNNGKGKNNQNSNMFNSDWFKRLSFEEQKAIIAAIQTSGNKGAQSAYDNYKKAQENLDNFTKKWQAPKIEDDAEYSKLESERKKYYDSHMSKLRLDVDYSKKLQEIEDFTNNWKPRKPGDKIENDKYYKRLLNEKRQKETVWEDQLINDPKYGKIKGKIDKYSKSWKPKGIEDNEEYRLLKKSFENAGTAWNSALNTEELQSTINNLNLERVKSRLEHRKSVKDDGGLIRHGAINLINTVANSDAGKGLNKFHREEWVEELNESPLKNKNTNRVGKAEIEEFKRSHPGAFYDKDKKGWFVKHDKDTVTGYLANNGDAFAKAVGTTVKTAAKTAGNAAMRITGWNGYSDKTRSLRELADARKEVANKLNTSSSKRRADKTELKAKEAESKERFGHIKKVAGTAGAAIDVAKTTLSSKARDNVIRQEGVQGLERRQAKLMYLLGDRSKETKIAVGDKKGLGLIDRVKANIYQNKINKNREQYRQSLNAQYRPPQAYAPYYYPRAAGFSEEQINALNGILSKDFSSEGAEVFEGLNLSWQPEEYAKLNTILETDFETLDAQIAETQPDMSEKKVKEEEKVKEQQVDDSQSGEIDVSDTIDYDRLDPETLTTLVDRTYYEAPEEEKRYQEMIAKGFAEKETSYNNFLESMSDLVDKSL